MPLEESVKRTLRNHKRQNLPKNPQSLDELLIDGLKEEYLTNEKLSKFCAKIDSLAFLKLCDIKAGLMCLKRNTPLMAEPVLQYFNETYVSGVKIKCKRTGKPLSKSRPIYPPEVWNVLDSV
ncbi:hypothetical protein KQX54_014287 [Cotesia glomerata]|uniref:Uncharacterized protein n=1 Tax=Cotesia glomerata TaxID=32391 RepID=A0AAV7IYN1_COTGL|nr:hypothetical protein KQX54_014287 [Cotesia glomerata]